MKRIFVPLILVLCVGGAFGQANSLTRVQREKTAMDYLREGSTYYIDGDFKKAIPPYQKAFDLEKANRTLDKTFWRVLVDNLGISYGITARTTPPNLKKAKEIFEYGITKDPDYPLFYYNLACTYAEMDNMDKAIEYLKLAFERKGNLIRGEKMPTPATDPSFERFIGNDKFVAVLQELSSK
jgi:tetratricopeptide (TPR) repeat protein